MADKLRSRDKDIDSRIWKRGKEDISAYWDCSRSYHKVSGKKKDYYSSPGEIQLSLKKEAIQERMK